MCGRGIYNIPSYMYICMHIAICSGFSYDDVAIHKMIVYSLSPQIYVKPACMHPYG